MERLIHYIEGIGDLRGLPFLRRLGSLCLLITVPSYVISYLSVRFLPPQIASDPYLSLGTIIFSVTLGPLMETYLMRLLFFIFRKFMHETAAISLCAALIIGGLHALQVWGLYAIWPFFVLGICYFRWEKDSVTRAMIGTTLLHSLVNAIGCWAIVAQLTFGE